MSASTELLPMNYQIGSYPAQQNSGQPVTTEMAVDDVLKTVGPYLDAVPDGEIDVRDADGNVVRERRNWIVGIMKLMEADEEGGVKNGIRVVKKGDYADYDGISKLEVVGDGIDWREIPLAYYDNAKASAPIVSHALQQYGLEGRVGMQIGVAGPEAIPTFGFGLAKTILQPKRHVEPFARATEFEIERIAADPELRNLNTLVQIEYPVQTIGALEAARYTGKLGARAQIELFGARQIEKHLRAVPAGRQTALHFCFGRYMGEPYQTPDGRHGFVPIVDLFNRSMARISKEKPGQTTPLPPRVVGIPIVPEGGGMPTWREQKNIIAQLADLALPAGTQLAPGIATPYVTANEMENFYEELQHRLGQAVAVAGPCGKASLESREAALRVLANEAEVVRRLRGE